MIAGLPRREDEMKTESDRLESLAEAVANAVPGFDDRIALEVYRRLAEGSPAPASDIAERAGAPVRRVEDLLSSLGPASTSTKRKT
jgi:uncharacterized Zn finger protein